MNETNHSETFNVGADLPSDKQDAIENSAEQAEASFDPGTPEQVWAWVDELRKVRSPRELWELAGIIDRQAKGADKADEALILRLQDKIAGASLLAPDHFIGAFVLPEHQKKGLGQKLIQESIKRLLARGSKSVFVEVCDQRALKAVQKLPEELKSVLDIKESFRGD